MEPSELISNQICDFQICELENKSFNLGKHLEKSCWPQNCYRISDNIFLGNTFEKIFYFMSIARSLLPYSWILVVGPWFWFLDHTMKTASAGRLQPPKHLLFIGSSNPQTLLGDPQHRDPACHRRLKL